GAGSGGAGSGGAGSAGAGAGGSSTAGSSPAAGTGGMGGAAGATAGAGGEAGAAGAAGAAGSGTPQRKPKCKSKPEQVIVIGDSYINWITHSFPDDLEREAGEKWRMYAVGGCSLGSGGLCLIPDQLDQAIKENPDIIAGVMSGGGNDILIADEVMFPGGTECKDRTDSPTVKACQDIVATAMEAGKKLMQKAADAGMRDVIYLFYPHIPGGGFGGMNPNYLLDYSLPMARKLCEDAEQRTEGKLRCHFIDLVPIFEGHKDWFADDGIHENSMGSAAMAKEVVKVAKDKCVAQPASSGCCEP
ncbi:MAG TPA: SGNH/GDSL hydrolase family protein, partial [Polyangiales bacterium]|nr:SGNH/GDSL hydrolase family protein [Polyangiales bacterium]